jgi:hypothetical protein
MCFRLLGRNSDPLDQEVNGQEPQQRPGVLPVRRSSHTLAGADFSDTAAAVTVFRRSWAGQREESVPVWTFCRTSLRDPATPGPTFPQKRHISVNKRNLAESSRNFSDLFSHRSRIDQLCGIVDQRTGRRNRFRHAVGDVLHEICHHTVFAGHL